MGVGSRILFSFFLSFVSLGVFGQPANPYAAYINGSYEVVEMPNETSPVQQDCLESDKNKEFVKNFTNYFGRQETKGSVCSLKKGEFEQIFKNKGVPLQKSSALADSVKDSQVVIAGEVHQFTDLKVRQDIINKFTELKGKGSCVVFELPETKQGLDSFMDTLKKAEKQTRATAQAWQADEQSDLIKYYETMIHHSKAKGAKVFGVDHPENFQRDDLSNPVRNKAMAQNIEKLIRDKSCSSVLLFVGKAHETKGSESDPAISTILKRNSLRVTTMNVQMTEERALGVPMRAWESCDPPKDISESTVIQGVDIPGDLMIAPRSGESMKFKDFDHTILVPFSQADYPCSQCYK